MASGSRNFNSFSALWTWSLVLMSAAPHFKFLGHLLRDDLINPVKMSVRPYVCTYVRPYVRTFTIKHNAATNQIVVFVKVDETFTKIWLSRSSGVRIKVTWNLNFQKWRFSKSISSAIFSTNQKNPTVSDTRPKYLKIFQAGFLNFLLVIESRDFKICQKIDFVRSQWNLVRC